jgi:hypothetical protein
MDATNLTGSRCRAKTMLRSHRGMIQRSTEGTIQHDIDNLGRRLISVRWDIGLSITCFLRRSRCSERKNQATDKLVGMAEATPTDTKIRKES